jgi:hypothetical protein
MRHPDALLGIGLGEAPLFRQCTFSIWKSEATLMDYARGPAHQAATQAALAEHRPDSAKAVRLCPELFRDFRVAAVDSYPDMLLETMRSVSPGSKSNPVCVVLTPGHFNSA